MKKALRETQTLRALVRFGHRPPATNKHTDRTDYNTLRRSQLARSVITIESNVSDAFYGVIQTYCRKHLN